MRFGAAWTVRRLGLALLGLPFACSNKPELSAPYSGMVDGGMDGPSLEFRPSETLNIAQRDTRELTVAVTPPAGHVVRFALLPGPNGDGPADAALDRDETTS